MTDYREVNQLSAVDAAYIAGLIDDEKPQGLAGAHGDHQDTGGGQGGGQDRRSSQRVPHLYSFTWI